MVDSELLNQQLRDELYNGNVDHVINIINENDDVDINFRDVTHDQQTILMHLCYIELDTSSLLVLLEAIFNREPDVNVPDTLGRTVLMHACIANIPMYVEGLLQYSQTDVTCVDCDGNSALTYAVRNCDVYTVS